MTFLVPELLETKTYPFSRVRRMMEHAGIQEGIWDPGDLKVAQRSAGATMSVDVAAGSGWIRGDDTARQGMYHVENDAVVNLAIGAAHATLPRVDQVIARVYDSTVVGGAQDFARPEILPGTPTSGAALDNAAGNTSRAALPATAIRLGEILVANGATSITNANIRDRRLWARGFYHRIVRHQNGSGSSNYAVTPAWTSVDATNVAPRFECSGSPVRVTADGLMQVGANLGTRLAVRVDGAEVNVTTTGGYGDSRNLSNPTAGASDFGFSFMFELVPAAGSRRIEIVTIGSGAGLLYARPDLPFIATFEELIRPSSANG